ncbi:MAG: MFS transporter [Trueperaceae bacterium]|nr:MFS transporter [Trueperaceae bacterium]
MVHPELPLHVARRRHAEALAAAERRRRLRRSRTPADALTATYATANALVWGATVTPMATAVLFATSRGFTLADVGAFGAAYAATVALLEVPSGAWADAWGRIRTVALGGVVTIAALAALLAAFDLPMLLTYAVLAGAGRALTSGALEAWFVDALATADPGAPLQPRLATANAAELAALALGTLGGSLLPGAFAGVGTGDGAWLTPLATPLLASIALHAVAATYLWVGVAPLETAAPQRAAADRAGVRDVLRAVARDAAHDRELRALLSVQALLGASVAMLEAFWQPALAAYLPAPETRTAPFGMVLAGGFGAAILGTYAATWLARRTGGAYARVAAAGLALQAGALAALAVADTAWAVAAAIVAVYLAMGGTGPLLATLLHARSASERRSATLSAASLATFLGALLGASVGGRVAEGVGLEVVWFTAAGLVAFASVRLAASRGVRRADDARAPEAPGRADVRAVEAAFRPGRDGP